MIPAAMNMTETWTRLSSLLEFPHETPTNIIDDLIRDLGNSRGQAMQQLQQFSDKMRRMDLAMRQEFYVQTFDLTAYGCLYISVHLFGEESFKRSELMAGLKDVYSRAGLPPSTELPDHLAVILRHQAIFTPDEWRDCVTLCLLPALEIMIKKHEKIANPYSLVLAVVKDLLIEAENSYA